MTGTAGLMVGTTSTLSVAEDVLAAAGSTGEHEARPVIGSDTLAGPRNAIGLRNLRMMHFLERAALRFNQARIPLMVLKGAALNLTLYDDPCDRPMGDLDLLIRPEHVDRALAILEKLGCRYGEPLLREDFFPRFHYERELNAGVIHPVRLDLHVRPFRPLRYARIVPSEAFWERARAVRLGRATVLVPSVEDMLIHLAVHSAVHGHGRALWLEDIRQWLAHHAFRFDWQRFMQAVRAWGLSWPVRSALQAAGGETGPLGPDWLWRELGTCGGGWRDRLTLRHAPRDAACPFGQVLVNTLCTPGWRFVLAYLAAVMIPGRAHMADWYPRRHRGWLATSYLLRAAAPLLRRIPGLWAWLQRIETRPSHGHGLAVFALRNVRPGEVIVRCPEQPVEAARHARLTDRLRYLNHLCRPNARLTGGELVALKTILAGQEITIDHGEQACSCRRHRAETGEKCVAYQSRDLQSRDRKGAVLLGSERPLPYGRGSEKASHTPSKETHQEVGSVPIQQQVASVQMTGGRFREPATLFAG